MSYKYDATGTITLKKGTPDEVIDKICEMFEKQGFDRAEPGYAPDSIDLSTSGSNYHGEELGSMYGNLPDVIEDAQIYFIGEDETYWRHEYEDGTWTEAFGQVVYDNPLYFAGKEPKNSRETEKPDHEEPDFDR